MGTVNDRDRLEARELLAGVYMQGRCSAFAIAVARRTGWGLVAIWDGDALLHSGSRLPDGRVAHALGIVSEAEFAAGWRGRVADCDERAMLAAHPQTEDEIRKAGLHADMMLELPGTCAGVEAYRAFAADLAALCDRHGIYLRGDMPSGAGIVAYPAYGDEAGFDVEAMPTDCASIVRRLS